MRISELSAATGVPVPTIKYYLRAGLLPRGTSTAARQANYDEGHVGRLRLIRALADIGGLSLATVRSVLDVVADPSVGVHDMLGNAQRALAPPPPDPAAAGDAARARVDELIAGWRVREDAPARNVAAEALTSVDALGAELTDTSMRLYADLARRLADDDLGYVTGEADRERMVERAVALTVLTDRLLVALRRLAQEDASARRFT